MLRLTLWTLVLMALAATPVRALAESGDRDAARAAFVRGTELAQQERWEDALESFDESLRLYPTQSALYNRALCLGLLGRPAEAVRDLEEHVRRYGATVDAERREEVQTELDRLRRRQGHIEVRIEGGEAATVLLNGDEVGQSPLPQPLSVNPGRHQITVQAPGIEPVSRWITVGGGDEASVVIALVGGAATGSVALTANVEGAEVRLDGALVGRTPLAEPFSAVEGTHIVLIEAEGYEPLRREIEVTATEEASLDLTLVRESEAPALAAPNGDRRGLRSGAFVSAGAAVASLGAALGLFLWNNGQYDGWETEDAALRAALEAGAAPEDADSYAARVEANNDLDASIHSIDVATWVLLGVGTAAAAAAVALFIVGFRGGSGSATGEGTGLALLPTPGGLSLAAAW